MKDWINVRRGINAMVKTGIIVLYERETEAVQYLFSQRVQKQC